MRCGNRETTQFTRCTSPVLLGQAKVLAYRSIFLNGEVGEHVVSRHVFQIDIYLLLSKLWNNALPSHQMYVGYEIAAALLVIKFNSY